MGLVVEAEPDKNFPEARGLVMDLFDGEARDIKVGAAADAQRCDFVITAPYSRWKQVAKLELDATKGMLQGKLKLKGDLPTIVRYTKASQELTDVHDPISDRMAGRAVGARQPGVVEYSSEEPSAFAQMLGGLIEANVKANPKKRQ